MATLILVYDNSLLGWVPSYWYVKVLYWDGYSHTGVRRFCTGMGTLILV